MYFWSLLQGHATSRWPTASGAPTECTHGTKCPSPPRTSNTARPIRVMIRMLTTTYGLSDTSMPMCAIGLPIGPIENGTTYIVRPRMQPLKRPSSVRRISARRDPVIGRAGVVLLLAADERAVLDPRHVGRIREGKVAAGPLDRIEPGQRAGRNHLRAQAVVFGLAAVAPDDAFRLRQRGDFADPSHEPGVPHIGGRADGCGERDQRFELVHRGVSDSGRGTYVPPSAKQRCVRRWR